MPRNLLFLSDKLPKPNYAKQFKASINNGIEENNDNNYRSYNKLEIDKSDSVENKDYKGRMLIKKPVKLMPLLNIPEEKEKEKEKIEKGNDIIVLNKENSKNNLIPNKNISSNNLIMNRGLKNSNKILLRKEEMYYLDVLSKQKNDLRKLMLKNSNLSRRLNYINNSQINPSSIKDLNKLLPNIINRSAPKKINNIKLLKKNGYMYNPSYMKNIEKYQKRTDKLDYDYGKIINQNIINNKDELKNGMSIKMPRRLIPLKIPFNKS
jgi:hypothetical protein